LNSSAKVAESSNPESVKRPKCGIVMPISAIDGCSESHWAEVLQILKEAISDAGFDPDLVSNSEDIGVIQKRIIQNLYENEMIVCDVSAKNANVMFELGIRLTFDKPAIVVKDDKTGYSFDTSPIEHLEYPRDLRFGSILAFKERLSKKVAATYEASQKDKDYTTFLKHFGTYKISSLETKEVTQDDFVLRQLASMEEQLSLLTRTIGARGISEGTKVPPSSEKIALAVRLKSIIENYCKRNKIKFADLNAYRSQVLEDSLTHLRPADHFSSGSEYLQFFNVVFDSTIDPFN